MYIKKNTTESKKSKKHINIEVLKEKLWKSKQYKKIKKLNESKKQRGNNITNKNKIDSKKSLKHIDENNITKQNIHTLLESYGMTTDNSKNIMIDRASELSDHLIDEVLGSFSLAWDDSVLEGDIDTLRKFGIKENEIKTVTKAKYGHLILEKVAVVDIIK